RTDRSGTRRCAPTTSTGPPASTAVLRCASTWSAKSSTTISTRSSGGCLRGNILGYDEVKAPKKLVVTGARNPFEAHKMFDQIEFHEKELLPFYDLHLKGANNGFMDADPVKLFGRGANVWRSQEAWPPRATSVAYYLRKG